MTVHALPTAHPSTQSIADRTLYAEGISVRYGGVLAVDSVSITVEPGQIVGLIGPNGAGKTSLIDALSGFVSPAAGAVRLGPHKLTGLSPHHRAHRGLIRTFQQLELFNDLTVAENITVASRTVVGRRATDEVRRVVELFQLDEVLDRDVSELSQGQRQLVALARAVSCAPSILLLDEPAAGLDSSSSSALAAFIRELASAGVGILLIDHDMSLVLSLCDRITVLDFGRQIAEGTPAEIRADAAVLSAYLGDQ